jgi:hypothetical protein
LGGDKRHELTEIRTDVKDGEKVASFAFGRKFVGLHAPNREIPLVGGARTEHQDGTCQSRKTHEDLRPKAAFSKTITREKRL